MDSNGRKGIRDGWLKKFLFACCVTVVTTTLTGNAISHAASSISDITVCGLAASPSKFDSLRVRVSGKVISDGMDVVGLVDPNCPRKGIRLSVSDEASKRTDVAAFVETVLPRGTLHRTLIATFTGTFRFRRGKTPDRVLEVESVSRLRIHEIR